MTAPLSIVIPTLNAGESLAATIGALDASANNDLVARIIVSDGGSTDTTLDSARALGAHVLSGSAGRGVQLQRGVRAIHSDWVLVLHADTSMDARWREAVERHIALHPDKAGYFRLRFKTEGLAPALIAAGANLRSRVFELPYGDQGLLISRRLYEQVGGYSDMALMEDVDIARRLRGHLVSLDADAMTSADRYLRNGWVVQSSTNLVRLAKFLLGADPNTLAKEYKTSRR